jgi:hypothetical protein
MVSPVYAAYFPISSSQPTIDRLYAGVKSEARRLFTSFRAHAQTLATLRIGDAQARLASLGDPIATEVFSPFCELFYRSDDVLGLNWPYKHGMCPRDCWLAAAGHDNYGGAGIPVAGKTRDFIRGTVRQRIFGEHEIDGSLHQLLQCFTLVLGNENFVPGMFQYVDGRLADLSIRLHIQD